MERLWTPWRRAFVEGAPGNGSDACFLCAKPAAHDDRANLILVRADQAYALLNLYPYNSGHLMVAPYLHTGDLAALDPAIATELMRLTQRCVDVLQRAYQAEGFNIGMNLGKPAGAVREFHAVVANKPIDPAQAHYDLARAYHLNKETEKAKDELLAALETAPGFRQAQKLLLELSGESGTQPAPPKK